MISKGQENLIMFKMTLIAVMFITFSGCGDKSLEYYKSGLKYDSDGKHQEAISAYNNSIKENPKYADAYNAIGVSYSYLGDKVFIENSNDYNNPERLKKIKLKFDYYENAIINFSKSISIQGKSITYYNMGKTYLTVLGLIKDDYHQEVGGHQEMFNYKFDYEAYRKKAIEAFKNSISSDKNSEYAKNSIEEILNIKKERIKTIQIILDTDKSVKEAQWWGALTSLNRSTFKGMAKELSDEIISDMAFIVKYCDRDDIKIELCEFYIATKNSVAARSLLASIKDSENKNRLEIAVNKMLQ
jgi:tetratricopeptide (TPR) repeat protein